MEFACSLPFNESFRAHETLKAHAAGDLDPLAVDPAIFFGKQRGDHLAAVIRLTDAAKRCHLRNALVDFGIIADHPAAEVGRDGAGGDSIEVRRGITWTGGVHLDGRVP